MKQLIIQKTLRPKPLHSLQAVFSEFIGVRMITVLCSNSYMYCTVEYIISFCTVYCVHRKLIYSNVDVNDALLDICTVLVHCSVCCFGYIYIHPSSAVVCRKQQT